MGSVLRSRRPTIRGYASSNRGTPHKPNRVRPAYVVGQVWGRIGADFYLLDQVRGRYDFDETIMAIKELSKRWPTIDSEISGSAGVRRCRSHTPKTHDPRPYSHNRERVKGASRPRLRAGLAIKERLHTETG